MSPRRIPERPDRSAFGSGQHGGEPLEIEQGGRHGQEEKGDAVREPRQGGAGYRSPAARRGPEESNRKKK
jgi:hypothetical protein